MIAALCVIGFIVLALLLGIGINEIVQKLNKKEEEKE